jgi:L-alanine-DL-glutamate epimerase-like enolase superfamily enzyme
VPFPFVPLLASGRSGAGDALSRSPPTEIAVSVGSVFTCEAHLVGETHRVRSVAVEISARIRTLHLAQTFVISRESSDSVDVVEVELRHEGVTGFGEAAPIERYHESAESSAEFLGDLGDLLGDDPWALEELAERLELVPLQQAAKAALDAALHDLQGRLVGQPVWRLLGLQREGPPTSWTVWLGDPDDMARRAERAVPRFERLKLKLGGRDGLDVERVRAVAAAAPQVPLQVDVNEYWALEEALEAIPQLAALGVEYVEQPLPAGDDDAETLKDRSELPIFVDEDCHTLADVARCARIAHGINVKLAKSGGIREAMRMAHAARALDLDVMLGCMVESGLAIAAAAQIASLFDHVDLDGNLLLAEDPWPGVELRDGVQLPSDAPGLGVRPQVPDPR